MWPIVINMSAQVNTEEKIVEQIEKIDLNTTATQEPAEEKPASKMGDLLMKAHKEGDLEAKVEAAEAATEPEKEETVEAATEPEKEETVEVDATVEAANVQVKVDKPEPEQTAVEVDVVEQKPKED